MTKRTVGIDEAARIMSISKEALRKRIARGTVEAYKDAAGHYQVTIDDKGQDTRKAEYMTLVDALQSEIEFLRQELERKDRLLLESFQQVKQLQAAPEKKPRPWWQKLFGKEDG